MTKQASLVRRTLADAHPPRTLSARKPPMAPRGPQPRPGCSRAATQCVLTACVCLTRFYAITYSISYHTNPYDATGPRVFRKTRLNALEGMNTSKLLLKILSYRWRCKNYKGKTPSTKCRLLHLNSFAICSALKKSKLEIT